MYPRTGEKQRQQNASDLKNAKRRTGLRIEWPTVVLAVGIYAAFAALTWGYHEIPWWTVLPLAGVIVCLHGSLQHEAVHGHPTGNALLNELVVFPSLWLWLPFRIYRDLHTRHHETEELTDPRFDPESYYVSDPAWQRLPAIFRAFYWIRNSLLGRLLLGPLEAVAKTYLEEGKRVSNGDFRYLGAWAIHLVGASLVLFWVLAVCRIPLAEYLILFAYPGLSLTLLRSYLEHRAHQDPKQRTVLIEAEPFFALLFLNNNLHALHHAEPQLAWYQLPARYSERRAALLAENGGYHYRGYLDIARQYLFRPKETPRHPALTTVE